LTLAIDAAVLGERGERVGSMTPERFQLFPFQSRWRGRMSVRWMDGYLRVALPRVASRGDDGAMP